MSKGFRLQSELQLRAIQRRIRGEDKPGAALAKADVLYRPSPGDEPARSKYGNERTNGYASKREAKRAEVLKLMAQAGQITELREQVRYELIPAQYDAEGRCIERAWTWTCDFQYRLAHNGELVIEDAKGVRTREYIQARKMMLQKFGIRIQEV